MTRCPVCDGLSYYSMFTKTRACNGCGHAVDACSCAPAVRTPEWVRRAKLGQLRPKVLAA